ncbi:sensor histidine kinase [Amycolatopsis cihanbeyliensis]|uniref:histidine kinase n=1 Tax=Amycolatopsis cihanbeyliensis TaxID=1128664 RepID=A0A542DQ07_AMYCI|nr:histidine kinase [Amycolatopsis cihanbeyliensis]TQJ05188.1 signal transduction histidine kinase [Amycolatopsis cihanbeyliensis]
MRKWRHAAAVLLGAAAWVVICALVVYETRRNPTPWELIGGLACTTVALAALRRLPLVALAVAAASSFAVLPNYFGRFPVWPVLLMLTIGYLAGRRMEHPRPALLTFAGIAVAGLPAAFLLSGNGLGNWVTLVLTLLFAVLVPWHLGRYVRLRAAFADDGWERAVRLEARQRATAEQARLRERARIANDMHDSLGHELSLIALRAAALEVDAGLGERQRGAAGDLRESAATATERLREIIGVLREGAEPSTRPAGESTAELVERAVASGMRIESTLDEADGTPPMVDRAVHRIVQESLTNVAKHAPGARVRVTVERGDTATTVLVGNGPPAAEPGQHGSPGPSGRYGLAGLRERVRLVGGTLHAGPAGAGFEVHADLPHDTAPGNEAAEAAAPAPEESESARRHVEARRAARSTLLQAVAIPTAALIVTFAVSAVYYLNNWYSSALSAEEYAGLRVGQTRSTMALPDRERAERPVVPEPASPPGVRCEYYGTDASLLGTSGDVYRLCFSGGLLVAKRLLENEQGESG